MKDKSGEKITKQFLGLRAKSYNYLTDGVSENEKANHTKSFFIKRKLTFPDYKNHLEVAQLENKIKYPKKVKLMHIVF